MNNIVNISSVYNEFVRLSKLAEVYNESTPTDQLKALYRDSIKVLSTVEGSNTAPVGRAYLLTEDGLKHSSNGGEYVLMPIDKGLKRLVTEFHSPIVQIKHNHNVLLSDSSVFVRPDAPDVFEGLGIADKDIATWTVADIKNIAVYLLEPQIEDLDTLPYTIGAVSSQLVFELPFLDTLHLSSSYTTIFVVYERYSADISVSAYNESTAQHYPLDISLDDLKKVLFNAMNHVRNLRGFHKRRLISAVIDRPSPITPHDDKLISTPLSFVNQSDNLLRTVADLELDDLDLVKAAFLTHIGVFIELLTEEGTYRKGDWISYMIEKPYPGQITIAFFVDGALGRITYDRNTRSVSGNPVDDIRGIYHILHELCCHFLSH